MFEFFFARESPQVTAIVRVGLAVVLLSEALTFWPFAVEMYSTAGPALPFFVQTERSAGRTTQRQMAESDNAAPAATGKPPPRLVTSVHPPIPSPAGAVLLATVQLFALSAVALGWRTRWSLVIALVSTASLAVLGGLAVMAKYTVLALHFLLYLICTRCGEVWSLDAVAAQFKSPVREHEGTQPVWPRRLMQLTVCHMYLGAALTKLHVPGFFTGDLLEFTLLDDDWGGGRFGLWLATQRSLVVAASLVTFLIELLFPFLIWVQRCRLPMLAIAFGLHALMGLTMTIGVFSPVMFVVLLIFLTEEDLAAMHSFLSRRSADVGGIFCREALAVDTPGGLPSQSHLWRIGLSWPGYCAAALVSLGIGWGVQWYRDDYGVFGRRVVPPLVRFSKAEVEPWLAELKPQWSHYIHEVRVGSRVHGQQVFGSSTQFRRGEWLWLVVRFNTPHPSLKLEGLLIAPVPGQDVIPENAATTARASDLEQQARRAVVGRFSQKVEGAYSYAVHGFDLLPDLTPGEYTLILQVEGYDVWHRSVELVPE